MAINPDIINPSSSDGNDAIEPPVDWSVWRAIALVAFLTSIIIYIFVLFLNSLFHPLMMLVGLIYLFTLAIKKLPDNT